MKPTPRMINTLIIGINRDKRERLNGSVKRELADDLAIRQASRAIVQSVNAMPTLNRQTVHTPCDICPADIAESRTASAVGHGTNPAADAKQTDKAERDRFVFINRLCILTAAARGFRVLGVFARLPVLDCPPHQPRSGNNQ